jgi:hypothetical protein
MLQGLFYISLFFITILGILILRPTPIEPLTRKPTPVEIETRDRVTRGMAHFLEQNPTILNHPPHVNPLGDKPSFPPVSRGILNPQAQKPVDLPFQGTSLHFQTPDDLNAWIYENAARNPSDFLRQLDAGMDSELKLDILRKTGEVELPEEAKTLVKEMLLSEASSLLKVGDPGHEQLAEKYLNLYLEREPDASTAKKRVDEVLKPSSTPHQ